MSHLKSILVAAIICFIVIAVVNRVQFLKTIAYGA